MRPIHPLPLLPPAEPRLFSGDPASADDDLATVTSDRIDVDRRGDGRHGDGRAFVSITGTLRPAAYRSIIDIAGALAADRSIGFVMIRIDSRGGEPCSDAADAVAAILALTRKKPTAALVANTEGPALLLALATRGVWASATGRLGRFGTVAAHNLRSHVARRVMLANADTIATAAAFRPTVAIETWRRLLTHTVTGEQAEALGIVDQLMDVDRLMYPNLIGTECFENHGS
jgi:ClpP class serine protease